MIDFSFMTLAETERFGYLLGKTCCGGDIICLEGDLGSGKTTLTKSIAKGCQVDSTAYVSSPTYALLHEYPGTPDLCHMDFYRLDSAEDILLHGLDEYFYQPVLSVIEWYEIAEELLPEGYLVISMENEGGQSRLLHCDSSAARWQQRLLSIKEQM